MSRLIEFLSGRGPDHAGRTISQICDFSDEELEGKHDYIQWLFPNRQPSRYNPKAPILTDQDIEAVKSSPEIQGWVERSFQKMWNFYALSEDQPLGYWWESPRFHHNLLRMSRMLLFLNEIERQDLASKLHETLLKSKVPERTKSIWLDSMGSVV